jgi:phosphate-selective porin
VWLRPGPGCDGVLRLSSLHSQWQQRRGGGLATQNGNANQLWQTDLGINWWMTQYFKMVLDWNHVEFNNPVTYATGKTQPTGNIFWWRVQLYF